MVSRLPSTIQMIGFVLAILWIVGLTPLVFRWRRRVSVAY